MEHLRFNNNKIDYKIIILMSIFCFIYFILPPYLNSWLGEYNNADITLYLKLLLPPILIFAFIVLLYRKVFVNFKSKLDCKFLFKNCGLAIALSIGLNIIWIAVLTISGFKYEDPAINKLIMESDSKLLIVLGFSAIVLAPIVEEITFRKLLYDATKRVCSIEHAMIITSLIFALVHLEMWQIPGLFVLGYYFQKIANQQNSLESAISAHAINNSLSFLALMVVKYIF